MSVYDVIVVGAGHNGLICACYLAKAGRKVDGFNLGVGNYNTLQELTLFREVGAPLKPDIIVLAYFINDAEPINMFEFSRPVVEACGQPWPRLRAPGRLVWFVMTVWQWFHFRFGLPKQLLEPLAVERLYLDNYFSIAKAQRDLEYQPLFTTERALAECLPYYVDLFHQMKAESDTARARVIAISARLRSLSGR